MEVQGSNSPGMKGKFERNRYVSSVQSCYSLIHISHSAVKIATHHDLHPVYRHAERNLDRHRNGIG
jgi:hypothetical protein